MTNFDERVSKLPVTVSSVDTRVPGFNRFAEIKALQQKKTKTEVGQEVTKQPEDSNNPNSKKSNLDNIGAITANLYDSFHKEGASINGAEVKEYFGKKRIELKGDQVPPSLSGTYSSVVFSVVTEKNTQLKMVITLKKNEQDKGEQVSIRKDNSMVSNSSGDGVPVLEPQYSNLVQALNTLKNSGR